MNSESQNIKIKQRENFKIPIFAEDKRKEHKQKIAIIDHSFHFFFIS